jgi:uncharacterized repeat protein (TIGR01451 family)
MTYKSMILNLILILSLLLTGIQPVVPVTAAVLQPDGSSPETHIQGPDGLVTPKAEVCMTPISISQSSDDTNEQIEGSTCYEPAAPSITKSVDKSVAAPGDTLTYTINGISSNGNDLLTDVTVTDTIPAGTTYIVDSDTPEATVTPSDTTAATLLTWHIGSNTAGTPGSAGGGGGGAVTWETTSNRSGTDVSSLTFSHTTGSGANRLLLLGISWRQTANITVSTVTWGGTALSPVGTIYNGNTRRVAIYQLLNPSASTPADLVIIMSGVVANIVAGAASFSGVDQKPPLGFIGNSATSTNPNVTVTTSPNDLVFDTVTATNGTLTVGNDQTSLWNVTSTSISAGGSTKLATTTSTLMSWTSNNASWAIGAVPIKPAAADPAIRTTTLSTSPTLVSTGVPFTLTATFTNTVADTNVTPSTPTPTVTGSASVSCGSPSPASGSINAGGSLVFTWTCTPTASTSSVGTVALSVSATGTSYSYPSGLSNTVLVVPDLTFQVTVNDPVTLTQVDNYATLDDSGSYISAFNAPVLEQPTNGATSVPTSLILAVTASDPNANNTSLTVNFYGRIVGESFGLIGTVSVANGSLASLSWNNLASFAQYEWYVIISDGSLSATSPIWGFTTSDSPTAVTLTSFNEGPLTNGVRLEWSTATEVGLLGFNLYRSDSLEGGKQKLNLDLIPALTPGDLMGNAYQFTDGTAISGRIYQYWIELVMQDGIQQSDPLTVVAPYWIRLPMVVR